MIPTRRAAATAAVLTCTLTAAMMTPAEASTTPVPHSFYKPPTSLPSQNGAIIRSKPFELGVRVGSGSEPMAGKGTLLMYKSTDTNGKAVAVTGTYIEPAKKWSGPGARPLVTFAEGTQGQGDACAPSKTLASPLVVEDGEVNVGYEIPSIYGLLDQGIAVVVTDYIGLGTPGIHTYASRVDQAHAVLDAARAARSLPGTSLTSASKVGAFGYSQGGGATAAAAELAPTYAPELPLVGAYAGAPPADLKATLDQIDGTSLTGLIGYAINGFVSTYPQLQPIVNKLTNDAGKAALKTVSTACTGSTLAKFAFKKTSEWTTTGQSVGTILDGLPVAKTVIAAQKIGNLTPRIPVRIATGTQDDIVPHAQAKALAADWCAKGASVTYQPVIQLIGTGGSALNHITPLLSDSGDASKWLVDRFSGKPNISNCALLPILP